MKKINLIIIALFSLALIASCGEEKEDKESKKSKKSKSRYENAYSKEAQLQMKNMTKSATNYYLDGHGEIPPDCYESMVATGHIEVSQDVIDSWDFECNWEYDGAQLTGQVTATSTDENDAGPGKIIQYDILDNNFTGYGQGTDE